MKIIASLTYLRAYIFVPPDSASAAPNQVEVVRTAAAAPDHQSPDCQTPDTRKYLTDYISDNINMYLCSLNLTKDMKFMMID